MFNIDTEKEIKERIFKSINNDLDKSEGSFINDIVGALVLEIVHNQEIFKQGFLSSFIETAKGELLNLRCKEHGVYRKQGEKAKGIIILRSQEIIEIPKGTILINRKSNLRYLTTENTLTNNNCFVISEGIEIKYNLNKNNTLSLYENKFKIEEIEIIENIQGGENVENDDDLRERLYFIVSNPEGVGTVADYKRWALEIDGVKIVEVLPCFYGNGTVKIIIGGEYGSILDDDLVNKVQNYICPLGEEYGKGKAPIGAQVTVATFESVPISIKIDNIKIEETYNIDIVKEKLEKELKHYLFKTQEIIRYNEIISVVIESYGVLDFESVYINDGKENINLNFNQKGELINITYE